MEDMEEQIIFSSKLQQRITSTLNEISEPSCGLLMGRWVDDILIILSSYHCASAEVEDIRDAIKESRAHFPGGIDICGLYFSNPSNLGEDVAMRCIRQSCANVEDELEATHLLICVHRKSLTLTADNLQDNAFWYDVEAREASEVGNFTEDPEAEAGMWRDLVTFRLRTTLQLIVPYHDDVEKVRHDLSVELNLQIESIQSPKTAFHMLNSPVLLRNPRGEDCEPADRGGAGGAYSGILLCQPCGDILQKMDISNGELQIKRKIKDYGKEIVNVSVLRCATPQSEEEKSAFLIYVDEVPTSYLTAKLPIDCLVMAESSEPVVNLPPLFSKTITNQLAAMGKCICRFYKNRALLSPRPVHIKPLGFSHVLTLYYPDGKSDEELADYRRLLHSRLPLPADRPSLRKSNRLVFPDEKSGLTYLQNTHIGLPRSGVVDGEVACVEGVYSYHHYMQDNINDNGWGCAYRSLQTIVSWFRHQGYTQQPVPTHEQIQQALVDIGDKEPSFVGSRHWIGSTEVGFCLDQLLGVQSRFLVVNAGRELVEKGRELAQHFQQQGTPVMIGGGVLAHTILGVDFNQRTGDLKFLILDPHYTGPEEIKEIQSKGWCGWKGPEFWDQTAFYNLCMPQRPPLI